MPSDDNGLTIGCQITVPLSSQRDFVPLDAAGGEHREDSL
jgi:hypothetical protein